MSPCNSAGVALWLLRGTILLVRVIVYSLVKRPPFTERVLVLGGGSLAAELGRQIRTRPDLALTCVGFLGEDESAVLAGPRLGTYHDVADAVARCRPNRIIVAMPDRRNPLPVA